MFVIVAGDKFWTGFVWGGPLAARKYPTEAAARIAMTRKGPGGEEPAVRD